MKRAELRDELERLGTRPVPMPDHHRFDALEQRLLQEFVVAPVRSGSSGRPARSLQAARRRRRQVLVAGLGVTAAAAVAAVVLSRGGTPGYQLQTATGAVALFPDGISRPVQAGDHVPAGGLIRTGPAGSITIDDTTVGADQFVLLADNGITLLPALPPAAAPAIDPQTTAPVTAGTSPPSPASAVPPDPPVQVSSVPAEPAPIPAAAADPAPLGLVLTEEAGSIGLSWTASDAEAFHHYTVVRGTAAEAELTEIVTVSERQITQFTDTSAAHDVELLYQVVAVGADGLPVARSQVMAVTIEGTGGSEEIPTTTAPVPGTDPVPSTDPVPTTEPVPTTAPDGTTTTTAPPGPPTTVPSTDAPPTTPPTTQDEEPAITDGPSTTSREKPPAGGPGTTTDDGD